MICAYCAADMPDISAFCPDCGRAVARESHGARARDLPEALLGTLAYFGVLPAVILLAIPATRAKPFVRFHSWQSLLFAAVTAIAAIAVKLFFLIFSALPVVGFLFSWLLLGVVAIAIVILWLVLVIKALQRESYQLPWIGKIAAGLGAWVLDGA